MPIKTLRNTDKFEFHISKKSREKYNFEEELFSLSGEVIFENNEAVRKFTALFNESRSDNNKISHGLVKAAGLMDEIFHFTFRVYEEKINAGVFEKAVRTLSNQVGIKKLRALLSNFVEQFPPFAVYRGVQTPDDYLTAKMPRKSNIEITLEEIILLYFDNFNPANRRIRELFDESNLEDYDLYTSVIYHLDQFFQNEKPIGKNFQDIFSFLREPILQHPDDIEAQLDFIVENWTDILTSDIIQSIKSGKDLLKEDYTTSPGFGPPPTIVPSYKGEIDGAEGFTLGKSGYQYGKDSHLDYQDSENFTPDIHWMPQVVLLAKNIYVWLDQLSKKYGKIIRRLDQVPDEELDLLRDRNFTGLWLIGLWERSNASRKIKHKMGNPDAVASAYSLFDYQIANDLGGEKAYEELNKKCKYRGIRLASDMVPNHTGIYSKWVIEHPDYFVQTNYPPYANYTFNGEDLSEHSDIEIKIEDGYYNHTDAAVVFRWQNKKSGEVKYIFHGNDGTNMPWNDTAQLNYLIKDVREAVIQQIFAVARKFSIIRFDAAMTLAKKHFQRLWYPAPGTGGDIPSRSDYSMSNEEFNRVFPVEFWREVVDRINAEMPDTLLLAEAFWLMEGYFVRTLGMHRVYNSAFMNMIMREENNKYKELIKNTLEYDPEILKRYVNFMSNPDEETAIKQFGTGDKYFGVLVMMTTLPGLPMFAHGQVEGFTEKYGMEYKRAYYNEIENEDLIERHNREIFPLIKQRYIFSEVNNFWLYDFSTKYGSINNNVFAYTNRYYNQKAFIIYNNKYDSTEGFIKNSSKKLNKNNGDKNLEQTTISEALELKNNFNCYYILKESISGKEYLINSSKLAREGFYIRLKGFEYKVFLDFREVYDSTGELEILEKRIGTEGINSVYYAIEEIRFEDIIKSFNNLINDSLSEEFEKAAVVLEHNETETAVFISNLNNIVRYLHFNIEEHFHFEIDDAKLLVGNERVINTIRQINSGLHEFKESHTAYNDSVFNTFKLSEYGNYHENALFYLIARALFSIQSTLNNNGELDKYNYLKKLHLEDHIAESLRRSGKGEYGIAANLKLIEVIVKIQSIIDSIDILEYSDFVSKSQTLLEDTYLSGIKSLLSKILEDEQVKDFLNVNEYRGTLYYRKENFEELIEWLFTIVAIKFELVFEFEQSVKANKKNILEKEKVEQKFIKYSSLFNDIKQYPMLA